MADNNLARSRNDAPEFFADGDPLAELARIIGYEERTVANPAAPSVGPAPVAASGRREPAFNLEDELLREFEQYDTPRIDPVDDIPLDSTPYRTEAPLPVDHGYQVAPPMAFEPPVEREPVFEQPVHAAVSASQEDLNPFDAPEFAVDPFGSSQVKAEQVSPAIEPELAKAEPNFDPSDFHGLPTLRAEVDGADDDQPATQSKQEPSVDAFDLAAELESSFAVASEPVAAAAVVSAPQPVRAEPRKSTGYTPGFRMPLANFGLNAGVVPLERPVEKQQVFEPQVIQPKASEPQVSQPQSVAMPVMPARAAEPVAVDSVAQDTPEAPKFSPLDELIYDVARFPVTQEAPKAVRAEPRLEMPKAPAAKPQPVPVAPIVAAAPVVQASPAPSIPTPAPAPQVLQAAPVAEMADEFDPFADEDFELALDDLELDLADIVVAENTRQPVAPAAPIPAPVSAPVAAAAPMAAAAPVAVAPEPEDDVSLVDAEMPFDAAMISESEEQVEAIADLNVPDLPVEQPDEEPAYASEYDIDIDAELAALLVNPASQSAPSTRHQDMSASAPMTAGGMSEQPRQTTGSAYPDLDDFERALEEDFRRSLVAPLPANDHDGDLNGYENDLDQRSPGSASRRWLLPIAVAGVLVVAGAGAYTMMGSGPSRMMSGEPVVIAADTDPVKVVPENPGGKTVPNQDKAVYDRVAGAASETLKQQALISSEEQPVDVVQKTLMPENFPLEGENDIDPTDTGETQDARLLPDQGQQVASTGGQDPLTVTPRRVKTMIVRPDGKLVEQEVQAPALAPSQSAKIPAASVKSPELAQPATPASAIAASAPAASTVAEIIPASAPMTAATMAPLDTAAPAAVAKAPVPKVRPSQQPVNVVASVSDQGTVRAPAAQVQPVAATPAAASTQVAPAGGAGGYVIQIASLPSQADAQRSYQNLSSKFGSVIGGRGVDIKAAEIAGKGTFYRVRIPAGSKPEAVALCEKYRGVGGTCLVAR
jgi:hypothetical protein